MTGIATDHTRLVRVQGLNGSLPYVLLLVVQTFHQVVQLGGKHFYLLNGMHAPLTGLESFFTLPHVGDHLLNQVDRTFNSL